MKYTCEQCGETFEARKRSDRKVRFCSSRCFGCSLEGNTAWNKGIPMSEESKKKLSEAKKGKIPKNHFEKGNKPKNFKGSHITTQGYINIFQPHHPRCTVRGYVLEHVLVAEKKIGRFLTEEECVHHINHIKTDNRPENIEVMLEREHLRLHYKERVINKSGQFTQSLPKH